MTLLRRSFLRGLGVCGASLGLPAWADASTLTALSLEELVQNSTLIVEGTPLERRSRWLDLGGSRRIATTTRLEHEAIWLGPQGYTESEVLTWGGRVGDLAQKVHGEAELVIGQPLVLFLQPDERSRLRVTGMAQGQFLRLGQGANARLARSAALPELRSTGPGKVTAARRLHALGRDEARALVAKIARELGR